MPAFFSNALWAQFAITNEKDEYYNVRSSPEAENNIIHTLSNGHLIYFLEPASNWINIDDSKDKLQQLDIAIQLPNLPAAAVPFGKTPEQNEIMREGGSIPELPANAQPIGISLRNTTSLILKRA